MHSRKYRAKKRQVQDIEEDLGEWIVLETYGSLCHICGGQIDLSANRQVGDSGWEYSLHFDHVIPLSKDGTHTLDSLKPAQRLRVRSRVFAFYKIEE